MFKYITQKFHSLALSLSCHSPPEVKTLPLLYRSCFHLLTAITSFPTPSLSIFPPEPQPLSLISQSPFFAVAVNRKKKNSLFSVVSGGMPTMLIQRHHSCRGQRPEAPVPPSWTGSPASQPWLALPLQSQV